MTISNNTPRVQITADGTVGPFTFTFRIFEESDLRVFDGSTQKTLATDYTISFDFDDVEAESGSITFVSGQQPTNGSIITIDRQVGTARVADFQQSGQPIQEAINEEFDKVYAKFQEVDDDFSRLVRLSDTSTFTGDLTFPDGEADKAIVWNSAGDGLLNLDLLTIGAQSFPLAFTQGGTGASYADAAALRTGIGLAIGSDVQAFDTNTAVTDVAQEWTAQQNFNGIAKNAVGADLVTNGAFATDTDWTKGDGWTIASGTADVDGSQAGDSDLEQDIVVVNGNSYEVIFTVSDFTAGTIIAKVGGASGTARSANGTFTETIVAGGGSSPRLEFTANATGDMKIDNVSVKELNVSWDLNLEQTLELTLDNAGLILDNPTNQKQHGYYTLVIKQDGTGGRSLTFGSNFKWKAGTVPSLSTAANAVDIISFISDGTNMYGVAQLDFS